jgi:site-specific DNA-adenine methylase
MADLTNLESKLGEVAGLAMAAKTATQKVMKLAREDDNDMLVTLLERMQEEAAETEQRCTDLAGDFEGKKTAILEEARETKEKASRMLEIYLDEESDVLDGFEFLTMAEAGEAGHWEVLEQMAKSAKASQVEQLVSWALPIQQRHFETARETSAKLASDEDPNEES